MNHELDETRDDDIEILEQGDAKTIHECGNHELHEAAAEYLTEQADEGLENFQPGEFDPAQLEEAHHLSEELGDEGLQNWLHDEVSKDLQNTLDRIEK